ncbi:uncharacterized protein LOC144872930 [Branchiostoma floridae x Branchiostoma japonicum]
MYPGKENRGSIQEIQITGSSTNVLAEMHSKENTMYKSESPMLYDVNSDKAEGISFAWHTERALQTQQLLSHELDTLDMNTVKPESQTYKNPTPPKFHHSTARPNVQRQHPLSLPMGLEFMKTEPRNSRHTVSAHPANLCLSHQQASYSWPSYFSADYYQRHWETLMMTQGHQHVYGFPVQNNLPFSQQNWTGSSPWYHPFAYNPSQCSFPYNYVNNSPSVGLVEPNAARIDQDGIQTSQIQESRRRGSDIDPFRFAVPLSVIQQPRSVGFEGTHKWTVVKQEDTAGCSLQENITPFLRENSRQENTTKPQGKTTPLLQESIKPTTLQQNFTQQPVQDEKFGCETCGKVFKVRSLYYSHMEDHKNFKLKKPGFTQVDDTKYRCNTCDREFATQTSVLYHLRIHNRLRCLNCNFVCSKKRVMDKHVCRSKKKKTGHESYFNSKKRQTDSEKEIDVKLEGSTAGSIMQENIPQVLQETLTTQENMPAKESTIQFPQLKSTLSKKRKTDSGKGIVVNQEDSTAWSCAKENIPQVLQETSTTQENIPSKESTIQFPQLKSTLSKKRKTDSGKGIVVNQEDSTAWSCAKENIPQVLQETLTTQENIPAKESTIPFPQLKSTLSKKGKTDSEKGIVVKQEGSTAWSYAKENTPQVLQENFFQAQENIPRKKIIIFMKAGTGNSGRTISAHPANLSLSHQKESTIPSLQMKSTLLPQDKKYACKTGWSYDKENTHQVLQENVIQTQENIPRKESTIPFPPLKSTLPPQDEKYTCKTCNKDFKAKSLYQSHVQDHEKGFTQSDTATYSCDMCDREFATPTAVMYHLRIHKMLRCPKCKFSCSKKKVLDKHVCRSKRVYRWTGYCQTCSATFSTRPQLNKHYSQHRDHLPIACPWEGCTIRFEHLYDLTKHQVVHTGETRYICEYCGQRFKHVQNLKVHIRIHTDEKPFKCDKCDYSGRQKHALDYHNSRHHGIPIPTRSKVIVNSSYEDSLIHEGSKVNVNPIDHSHPIHEGSKVNINSSDHGSLLEESKVNINSSDHGSFLEESKVNVNSSDHGSPIPEGSKVNVNSNDHGSPIPEGSKVNANSSDHGSPIPEGSKVNVNSSDHGSPIPEGSKVNVNSSDLDPSDPKVSEVKGDGDGYK